MNKIYGKANCLLRRSHLAESHILLRRSTNKNDDKGRVSNEGSEEKGKKRGGILHDKQASLQEESYFHKDELDKLKALKKKMDKLTQEKKKKDE